eukprot:gene5005-5821_t
MNFQPSQEQDMLVDAVRSFVAKELLPHEEAVDRADEVSPELAAQIRDKAIAAGFYAFNMPEDVGGGGLDYLSQALIERELSKVSWALHVFVARPSKILMACTGAQIGEYLLPASATAATTLMKCSSTTAAYQPPKSSAKSAKVGKSPMPG